MKRISIFLTLAALFVGLVGCDDKDGSGVAAVVVDDGAGDIARGEAALAAKNPAGALTAFCEAARKNPTNFMVRVQIVTLALAQGDVAAANQAAAEAVELHPESAEAYLLDGQAAYLKRDYARARADFNKVVNTSDLPAALRSEALSSRAVVELANNEFTAARISLLRAMRLNRRNASAWYHLGVLSRNTYHWDAAALEQFDMAARLSDPNEKRTQRITREILPAIRASLTRAAASRPGVAQRDPGKAAKLIAEGENLRSKRSMRNAIKKFEAALEADPLSDTAALHYAQLVAANDKSAEGVSKALKAYSVVIEQNPATQANYLSAARLAYQNGRWMSAISILERALAHDPENRNSLDLLIATLMKAGKTKEAEVWKSYRQEVK